MNSHFHLSIDTGLTIGRALCVNQIQNFSLASSNSQLNVEELNAIEHRFCCRFEMSVGWSWNTLSAPVALLYERYSQ